MRERRQRAHGEPRAQVGGGEAGDPPARKRARHLGPARRRPELLDAALELFLERGYEGTSMEAIAGSAGVSKPVVYDCFDSKDELFRALLSREEGRILSEIQIAFRTADRNDPEQGMTEIYTAFLRAIEASPSVYRLIFLQEGGGNLAIARRVQRGRQEQVQVLTALARRWLPDDSPQAAELAGYLLVGLAESGARALLEQPDAWSAEELGGRLARTAVDGVLSGATMALGPDSSAG